MASGEQNRGTPPSVTDVLGVLLHRRFTTRRQIAEITGLSLAGVTKALGPVIRAGLVRETSQAHVVGAGRPTQRIEVVATRAAVLGVKVTATGLTGVTVDLRGAVQQTFARPLPAGSAVPEVIAALTAMVAEAETDRPVDAVGVALSGDVDTRSGTVVLSPLLGWDRVPFADLALAATGRPVVIDNDVRALTLAEQWFGEAFDCPDFALVTVGEGIGCGLVINGSLVRGAFGVAGELGRMRLSDEGSTDGAEIEALAGRAGLAAAFGSHGARDEIPDYATLVRLAGADPALQPIMADAGRRLGLVIANLVNLVGPRRLMIATEGFDLVDAFGPVVADTIAAYAFGEAAGVEVSSRRIPFTDWARGAALVALTDHARRLVRPPTPSAS